MTPFEFNESLSSAAGFDQAGPPVAPRRHLLELVRQGVTFCDQNGKGFEMVKDRRLKPLCELEPCPFEWNPCWGVAKW